MKDTTTKKVKVIGTEEMVNPITGEIEPVTIEKIEDSDFNFTKVWLTDLLMKLDIISSKKMKVAYYIIDHINRENLFIGTARSIAEDVGVSMKTAQDTMKALIDCDLIRKVGNAGGVYRVNPLDIFRGYHNQRMNVFTMYCESEAPKDTPESDSKPI